MDSSGPEDRPTHEEVAWNLAEVFEELEAHQINEVLAKNVPMETLRFFGHYAQDFASAQAIGGDAGRRLPNLLLLGYLLRVVEERLLSDRDGFDA